ncbi:hypothetical protein CRV24_010256 [Beauveria bassiana]|nr:hypothetical protein CRV24_010256 [Beauveria bassiana]KAH8713791.1 hypothetical protein HC256_006916 [Beauveria bassiana]
MRNSDTHRTCWADVRPSLLAEPHSKAGLSPLRDVDTRPSFHAIAAGYAAEADPRQLGAVGAFKQSGYRIDAFLASNHKAYLLEPDLIPSIGAGDYPPDDQGNFRLIGRQHSAAKGRALERSGGIFGIPSSQEFADFTTLLCISLGWACYHCGMPAVVRCKPIQQDAISKEETCYQVYRCAETVICPECWESGNLAPDASLSTFLLAGIEYRNALHYELRSLAELLSTYTTDPRVCEASATGLFAGIKKMHSIYLENGLPLATAAPVAPLPPFVLERDCHPDDCPYKMDTSSRVRTYSKEWQASAAALNCSASAAQWAVFAVLAFDGYDRQLCGLDAGVRPVSLLYSKYKKLNTHSLLREAGWDMEAEQDPTIHSNLNRTVLSRMASDMVHFGSKTYLRSRHAASCHALTPVVALWRSHSDGQIAWIRQAYANGDTLACSMPRAFHGLSVLALASCCGDQVDTGLGTPYWSIGRLKGPDCLCVSCVRLVRTIACYVLGTYGYGTSQIESLAPYGAWIKAYLECAPFDLDVGWKQVAWQLIESWEQL